MDRLSFFNRGALRRTVLRAAGAMALTCFAVAGYAADGLAISGSPATAAVVGTAYSFTPSTADPLKKPLTFHIVNRPAWASFNTSTGVLTGTPPASSANTFQADVVISVSDGVATAYLPQFMIRVWPATSGSGGGGGGSTSGAPTISGAPSTDAIVGKAYAFTPSTTDPSKKTLAFRIVNRPAWASFNTSTGVLAGTPPSASANTFQADILISVTDGSATAYLNAFAIRVWPATAGSPDKPVISGTPATTASVGKAYAFQPTAKDPAGKALSFSIANKPVWATFSIASGLLNGTPSSSQMGSYGNIVITASNGSYATSLPAFNISVGNATTPPPPAGAAQLSWVPPTANTNGSALTDLAGVRIYYGTSQSSLSHSVLVAGNAATTYTISGLPAGTWYFGAEAYTTTGTASAMSAVVSKTIQ
jgi:hypothetical protein